MKNFLVTYGALITILLTAVFMRFAYIGDAQHFELDQARDIFVVYDALDNSQWPLLGPMARGSDLFLGPIFYYIQAFSASFFGTSPESVAYPDLALGIGAVILSFFYLRRYFSQPVTIAVSLLSTTSLYLITYSTFGWNPNSMFFWGIVFLWGCELLGDYESDSDYLTAILLGASVGVLVQLHFIAFLTIPPILFIYGLIHRKSIYLRPVILFFAIVFVTHIPVAISEVKTGASNTRALIVTITDKGNRDDSHNLLEKGFRATQETATYFTTTMISDQHGRDMIKTRTKDGWQFICDESCKMRLPILLIEIGLFLAALWFFVRAKKWLPDHLWQLMVLWGLFAGGFFVLLAYQISPRFYLFIMPLFILLWAIFLEWVYERLGMQVFSLLILTLLVFNGAMWHRDLAVQKSTVTGVDAPRDIILARSDRVTLGQLRAVSQAINQKITSSALVVGDNRYARAVYYLSAIEAGEQRLACYVKQGGMPGSVYDPYAVFVVSRTKSGTQIPPVLQDSHTVTTSEIFGTLSLYELTPKVLRQDIAALPEKCFVR